MGIAISNLTISMPAPQGFAQHVEIAIQVKSHTWLHTFKVKLWHWVIIIVKHWLISTRLQKLVGASNAVAEMWLFNLRAGQENLLICCKVFHHRSPLELVAWIPLAL
jgi:hypothetical protein